MKISIANTESARTEAQSLMNAKNGLNSVLLTLKYTQNILSQVWTSGAEIESINKALTQCINMYRDKILVAMEQLSNGVMMYCEATEALASADKNFNGSPSDWVSLHS